MLQAAQKALHNQTGVDLISALQSKSCIEFGRPRWEAVFDSLSAEHPNKRIGVFVCGPVVGSLPLFLPRHTLGTYADVHLLESHL